MALEHVTGQQLQTGMPLVVAGLEGQSGGKSAGGSLKTYRNKDGEICSLYAVDAEESEVTFEGLMKTSGYTPKDVGDEVTVTGVTLPTVSGCTAKLLVEEWEEVYQNDEVTKVRGKAHIYIVKNEASSGGGQT